MKRLKKYCVIVCTVFTVFTSSLIVAFATNCTITTGSSLYNVELTHWQTINFADYCTGTISLNYNGKTGWNYLILGASVTSAGSTITLAVDDCKQIMIIYYRNQTSAGNTPPTVTIKSNSTTSVTHVNQSYLESEFDTVDGYLSDIDSAVSTIKLYLADILLDNDNIQSQLTSIGNYLSTTNSSLSTLNNSVLLIMQQLQLIDYQVDTISWNTWTGGYTFGGQNSVSDSWVELTTNETNVYKYVGINFSGAINNFGNYIVWLHIPTYDNTFGKPLQFIKYNNSIMDYSDYCFIQYRRNYTDVYLYQSYPYGGYGNRFVFENPTYNYPVLEPVTVKYIESTDIEYWQLLQMFQQYKNNEIQNEYFEDLIELVSHLSSSNSAETTTNINNYNVDMDTINDIEVDLSADFGTFNTTFKNQNHTHWLPPAIDPLTTTSYKSVFTNIVGLLPNGELYLSLILLCAVVLALLG